MMETSRPLFSTAPVREALLATLLVIAAPCWAGPILAIHIGPGGKFHTGLKDDPDAVRGYASHLGSLISGTDVFKILKGDLWFNSEISPPGRHIFFRPGEQLLVYGSIDPNHDGGHKDRQDIWGVLIAAKLLNYQFLQRNGQTFFIANLLEFINPKLAALLGLHQTTFHASLELQLLQVKTGKHVYDLIEGGVLTTGAIPEPPSIVLVGIPALWFGAKRWFSGGLF
jgi:hypothetical protein